MIGNRTAKGMCVYVHNVTASNSLIIKSMWHKLHAAGTSSWEQYLVGFNDKYMQGIWPTEETLPGFK